jgi:hypothetical protein
LTDAVARRADIDDGAVTARKGIEVDGTVIREARQIAIDELVAADEISAAALVGAVRAV